MSTSRRVLLAPDSFKGTMSAEVVAAAMSAGVRSAGATAVTCPVADGGEGTLDVLAAVLGGISKEVAARDLLGSPMTGRFLLSADGQTAVVETATASGLWQYGAGERDAWAATSAGTGDLLVAASRSGARRVLLGVGGSGCTDGGAGALEVVRAAGGLGDIELTVLCDVKASFEQAAEIFGPQKGADPAMVVRLTERLHALAADMAQDPRGVPRTGAAGGLSGALWSELGAELVSGIDTVLDLVDFDELLTTADLVITGEGRLDDQTSHGKVIDGVTRRAAKAGVPVVAIVGQSQVAETSYASLGLSGVLIAGDPGLIKDAARRASAALGPPGV